jgi:hypothetical protein
MPSYYKKETVLNTWNHTLVGYLMTGSSTEDPKENALLLTVYFGTPNMFITLWFVLDYETNLPLGTLMI